MAGRSLFFSRGGPQAGPACSLLLLFFVKKEEERKMRSAHYRHRNSLFFSGFENSKNYFNSLTNHEHQESLQAPAAPALGDVTPPSPSPKKCQSIFTRRLCSFFCSSNSRRLLVSLHRSVTLLLSGIFSFECIVFKCIAYSCMSLAKHASSHLRRNWHAKHQSMVV